jgi:hypothetical protein
MFDASVASYTTPYHEHMHDKIDFIQGTNFFVYSLCTIDHRVITEKKKTPPKSNNRHILS